MPSVRGVLRLIMTCRSAVATTLFEGANYVALEPCEAECQILGNGLEQRIIALF